MGIGTATRLLRYVKRSDSEPHLERGDADDSRSSVACLSSIKSSATITVNSIAVLYCSIAKVISN